jgi:hypothetical protein
VNFYRDYDVQRYYEKVDFDVMIKKINPDLIIKKYRFKNEYEFLFTYEGEKNVLDFILWSPDPNEYPLDPCPLQNHSNNQKWILDSVLDEHKSPDKLRKWFRRLICSDGFVTYLGSEEIRLGDIYVLEEKPELI